MSATKARVHRRLVEAFARAILGGALAPGEIVDCGQVRAAPTRVSHSALREAFKVLAAKGLVEAAPRVGTRVRAQEHWHLLDADLIAWGWSSEAYRGVMLSIEDARLAIEPFAARLAAQRASLAQLAVIEEACGQMAERRRTLLPRHVEADLRFHQTILAASGNVVFAHFAAILGSAMRQAFTESQTWVPAARAHAQHAAVLEAIRARDEAAAETAMRSLLTPVALEAAARERRRVRHAARTPFR